MIVAQSQSATVVFPKKVERFSKIVKFYLDFEYKRFVEKRSKRELGQWTKNKLVEMGPTFIKIGQFLSTRTDILGEEVTDELKGLQDNVAPIDFDQLCDYLAPIMNYVDHVDPIPLASASIGQVHSATLKTGDKVVLKVKRPNIMEDIVADFETLLFGMKILKNISNDRKIKEFEILFNEYYNLLKEEIDFELEASNMQLFKSNFQKDFWVKIPKLYKPLCTNDIITMEYVQSIKITDTVLLDSLKFNRSRIAQKLVEAFIKQVIEHGVVHIDPHPGNVGMTSNGQIVFYDFGMVLHLDINIKEYFTTFLIAVYDKDINTICKAAIDMGLIVVEEKDIPYFKNFLIAFLSYIETADLNEFKISYINKVNSTQTPFLISSKFVLLLRGISILEGVCKSLDPNFNFRKTLDPYIDEFIIDINYFENRAKADLKLITSVPDNVSINKIQIEILEKTIRDMEEDMKKDSNNKMMMVLGVVASIIMQHEYNLGVLTASSLALFSYYNILNGKVHR